MLRLWKVRMRKTWYLWHRFRRWSAQGDPMSFATGTAWDRNTMKRLFCVAPSSKGQINQFWLIWLLLRCYTSFMALKRKKKIDFLLTTNWQSNNILFLGRGGVRLKYFYVVYGFYQWRKCCRETAAEAYCRQLKLKLSFTCGALKFANPSQHFR